MPEERQEKRRRGIPSPFTAVRMVRLGISAVRTVGAIGAFFANPASLAVLVPVGLFILAIFIIFFGSGFKGVPTVPGVPEIPGGTGEAVGIRLNYTIPFRNTSLVVADSIKAQQAVKNEFPAAQLQYWETIVARSKNNGWNPAFVLALWIEETGASHHTKLENGGGGISPLANGHLGCAPNENQTIDESLNCLFKNFSTYTNFETFMARYSGGPPTDPFSNNPDFPARIKRYYTLLVPSVASDCPVPGGRISTHSYQEGGHCAVGYGLEGRCRSDCPGGIGGSRRAKAIDIPTNGKDVILPTLQSQQVKWKLVKKGYPIATEDGGGLGHIFEANLGSDKWNLDMLHMQQTSLIEGEEYFSGTPVGKSYQPWVHTTIGKNVVNPTSPASYATDCDPGWQATDFICR